MLRQKRGHIPTFLLLIVALALIASAWFTFLNFDTSMNTRATSITQTIELLEKDDEYVRAVFERLVVLSIPASEWDEAAFNATLKARAADLRDVSDVSGNFFGKIRNGDYVLEYDEEMAAYTITVTDVFVKSTVQQHELTRTFDLTLTFNEDGAIAGSF